MVVICLVRRGSGGTGVREAGCLAWTHLQASLPACPGTRLRAAVEPAAVPRRPSSQVGEAISCSGRPQTARTCSTAGPHLQRARQSSLSPPGSCVLPRCSAALLQLRLPQMVPQGVGHVAVLVAQVACPPTSGQAARPVASSSNCRAGTAGVPRSPVRQPSPTQRRVHSCMRTSRALPATYAVRGHTMQRFFTTGLARRPTRDGDRGKRRLRGSVCRQESLLTRIGTARVCNATADAAADVPNHHAKLPPQRSVAAPHVCARHAQPSTGPSPPRPATDASGGHPPPAPSPHRHLTPVLLQHTHPGPLRRPRSNAPGPALVVGPHPPTARVASAHALLPG
jgi:hypothetical protein